MKKLKIILFTIFLLTNRSRDRPYVVQLLSNTNVESSDWLLETDSLSANKLFVTSCSSEYSFSGKHSLKISQNTFYLMYSCSWKQCTGQGIIPLGSTLTFRAKIKGVNIIGNGVALVIEKNDHQNSPQKSSRQYFATINGSFDWKTFSVSTPAVDLLSVFTCFMPNTAGTFYFDDITLSSER